MDRLQPHLDHAQKFVLDRVPKDRNSRLLIAGTTVTIASAVLYPLALHYALGRQITHTHLNAGARGASVECKEIESLPSDVIENAKDYRIAHDKVVKYMPKFTVTMSHKNEEIFTKTMRRNMISFSGSLQSYLLWFAQKELRPTFAKNYIESLEFQEGDRVCGVYEVVKRDPLKIELAIKPIGQLGPISGLIIVSVRPRNEGAVLTSETVQWVKKSAGILLPIETWLFGFMHSLTVRSLIVSSARYFESIAYQK